MTGTELPDDGCATGCGCSVPTGSATFSDTPSEAPPIACTLTGGDVQARITEWHTLLAGVTREPIAAGLRLGFPAPAPLAEIARLAEAEQACCAFLTFTITIDTRGVTLDVTAPDDGQTMIDSVFGSAS